MNYTTLSLAEVRSALEDLARDAQSSFGGLDARQLNWRPTEARWSVAQCFQHLLTSNQLMLEAAQSALANGPRSFWQRLPLLPGLFGPAIVRSQAPTTRRKYAAPAKARPAMSELPTDIVERFAAQQRALAEWMRSLDDRGAASAIMISPFFRFLPYSVLDGCRLMITHDHRHVEQARRVMTEFPAS